MDFSIYLKDAVGNSMLLSDAAFNRLALGISSPKTLAWAVSTGNAPGFAGVALRRLLRKDISSQKKALYDKMLGFSPKSLFVKLKGKEITLDFDDSTYFQTIVYLRDIMARNQYNALESNIKGKTVVDCGANIGIFSIFAACLGASKVYAFEPIPETFAMLKSNISRNGLSNIVVPINKAVGEADTKSTIYFSSAGDFGASFEINRSTKSKSMEVEICKIDNILGKECPGFIKMDIEGYEENALMGATETIKRCKPVLSFSAYHKPTDKARLPEVVRSIRPDYTITLLERGESDFYCE